MGVDDSMAETGDCKVVSLSSILEPTNDLYI